MNNKYDYEDELISDLQNFEYKEMMEKADNVVLGFAATTGATGAIPIPFADAPLLIGQQVAMMVAINSIFKFDVSKDALKSLATAAIGVGGATVVGKTIVANALKFIPGVGSVAGGTISATTAGFITLALGKAYIQICKAIKMGKLNQDDLTKKAGVDALKKAFKEQIKKNKKSS
ncbi:MAG: YcjF family protein [Enterocloster aldenensis]